jgi:hypothetical protein
MSTAKSPKSPAVSAVSVSKAPAAVRRTVLEVVLRESSTELQADQLPQSFGRLPMEVEFRVLPVQFDGNDVLLDEGQTGNIAGRTRDLSFEGMAFEHGAKIDERCLVAFFPALEALERALLFERLWTKELPNHEYLSGGRFVGLVILNPTIGVVADDEPAPVKMAAR